jgi:hypothetical protein
MLRADGSPRFSKSALDAIERRTNARSLSRIAPPAT